MFPEDKQGGIPPALSQMEDLGEVMELCNLMELPGLEVDFMWNNRHERQANIQEKSDHCLSNEEWTNVSPVTQVLYLPHLSFDH